MVNKIILTWADVFELADALAAKIQRCHLTISDQPTRSKNGSPLPIWGIPRGGAIVAGLLSARGINVTKDPSEAFIAVDDLIDSGRTENKVKTQFGLDTIALYEKTTNDWIEFPWEEEADTDAQDSIARMIEHIGDDPTRPGMIETPERVVRSWKELFSGYQNNYKLKWFEDDTDEMVVVREIKFFSTCEHHMLPFFGTADVGYIPNGAVVGLSKIARLVDHFARRFQIQERLARDIGEALAIPSFDYAPLGVAVRLRAEHLCMKARGAKQGNAIMETNYLTGAYRDNAAARNEFLSS